jgi:hypothetical protein
MTLRRFFFSTATAIIVVGAAIPAAFAANNSNSGVPRAGQACADTIRQKHPELKGSARSAEWGKCRADPVAYMKANQ